MRKCPITDGGEDQLTSVLHLVSCLLDGTNYTVRENDKNYCKIFMTAAFQQQLPQGYGNVSNAEEARIDDLPEGDTTRPHQYPILSPQPFHHRDSHLDSKEYDSMTATSSLSIRRDCIIRRICQKTRVFPKGETIVPPQHQP